MERKQFDVVSVNLDSSSSEDVRPAIVVQNDGELKNGLQPYSTYIQKNMSNFEKILTLTIEEMAHMNVKSFCYMNGYNSQTDYYTTDGSIFYTREEAEQYELEWLKKDVDDLVFSL